MYDLADFELSDMIHCGVAIRKLGEGATSMEEAATRITSFFYREFQCQATDGPCCALVRFFKTHPYSDLEPGQREFADAFRSENAAQIEPDTPCLTLLATAGELPQWNQRGDSAGHKAIPLISTQIVEKAPMIAQLILQMGMKIADVVKPCLPFLLSIEQKAFNVFYVPEALGSPYLPSQDFVKRHAIASVLGFGGMFPNGELFAVILFSKVHIPRHTADMFSTLALGVKLAIIPFIRGTTFAQKQAEEMRA